MNDLLELADEAQWSNGHGSVFWGRSVDRRGSASRGDNELCEDGGRHKVLKMHPEWTADGGIYGDFPEFQITEDNSIFKTEVGFLKGANGTDGVTFEVWVYVDAGGELPVPSKLVSLHKTYTESLTPLEIDLSFLNGMEVSINLKVKAGANSGKDWAVWASPRLEVNESNANSKVWEISPKRITILDSNEHRPVEGRGDEPYIGGIYFRSVFGQSGSTKVIALDTLKTLGSNIRSGRSLVIPREARLTVNDNAAINGIGVMGLRLVAMEEDRRGKTTVRSRISQRATDLETVLKEQVENSPAGWINAEQTRENIEQELFGGNDSSPSFAERFGRWIARYDDEIGQNTLMMLYGYHPFIGELNETHLNDMGGSGPNPDSRVDPVSLLKENEFILDFTGSDAKYSVIIAVSEAVPYQITNWS